MSDPSEFAFWARCWIDIMCVIQAIFVVSMATAYAGGLKHSTGGSGFNAACVAVNSIGVAAWLIWRPVF